MKIAVQMSYTITSHNVIDLPKGKSWSDVKDYYAKWGTLVLTFKDGTEFKADGGDADIDTIDFKRPAHCAVFAANEAGECEYEKEIAHFGDF